MSETPSELTQPIWSVITSKGWIAKNVDYAAADNLCRSLNTSDAVVTTSDAADRTVPLPDPQISNLEYLK